MEVFGAFTPSQKCLIAVSVSLHFATSVFLINLVVSVGSEFMTVARRVEGFGGIYVISELSDCSVCKFAFYDFSVSD